MNRVCMSCGSPQGPFAKLFIGDRKTGGYIFTCPMPVPKEGKPVTDEQRKQAAMACNNRRDKRATA